GTTAMDALKTDWGTVQFIAQLLQIQVDREKVETGRAKVTELLSQQGANTNFSGPVGSDIWTAAVSGDIEAVKQQLAKGVDVNAKNKDGASALHAAAIVGQYEVAELLIQKGANVNVSGDDGGTALHAAAFLGQYEFAKLLVQKGADVNARKNDGVTAMDVLKVDWGTTEFIARLLQIQVDREKVEAGRAQIVELLRQRGAK
ncbi:MAG: ankyrin repeat domain-containing protein, partial [Candidatus Poribacteria bacterium]|nr:ankyrin repeat domain-containing protein [Candidatus Poribacteria bacterium]